MHRAVLSLCLATSVLAGASQSRAAAIDITVERVPGTNNWTLHVDSHTGVSLGALELVVSNSLGGFTTSLPVPPVECALGSTTNCPGIGPGTYDFALAVPLSLYPVAFAPLVGPEQSADLGYFTSTASLSDIQVLPGDNDGHVSAFDTNGAPIFDALIRVVPEPGSSALAIVGVFALLARRMSRSA
jgi:hypothetical protein